MFTMFLFFIAGVFTHKALQFILSIKPNYDVYKHAEMCALNMLMHVYMEKDKSLSMLKLLADETDPESYTKIENAIKARYNELITDSIKNIKMNLPYKVSYNTIEEAYQIYISSRGK